MKLNLAALVAGLLAMPSVWGQVVVQNTTYPSGNTTVTSATTIQADTNVLVPNGANVNYLAGSGITLGAGFQVAAGGVFQASIAQGPAAPGSLICTATGSTYVSLTWTASTSPGIDHYTISRDGTVIGTVSAGTLSYTDNAATPGTTATYSVSAVDTSNNASPVISLSVTTAPPLEVFVPLP